MQELRKKLVYLEQAEDTDDSSDEHRFEEAHLTSAGKMAEQTGGERVRPWAFSSN